MLALDQFLASVQCRALRIAELSLKDRDDALDALQDAMLRFAERYAHKPEPEWPPLFYRILYNRITDMQRATQRKRGLFSSLFTPAQDAMAEADPLAAVADLAPSDPARLGDSEAFAEALEAALQTLPERQRQAFLLREWEGLDVNATATATKLISHA